MSVQNLIIDGLNLDSRPTMKIGLQERNMGETHVYSTKVRGNGETVRKEVGATLNGHQKLQPFGERVGGDGHKICEEDSHWRSKRF